MNEFILNIIILFHFLFIVFVLVTPFIGSNAFLILHITIIPFVIFHWILNNNTCSLTIAERFLRSKLYGQIPDDSDCITFNLIAPIYDFKKNNEGATTLIYVITISLWLIAILRLTYKINTKKYKNFRELLRD